ncbi:hypothetical protein R1sor_005702 [Riccia sorocarpa]|uniref:Uncharacterized protein n=1 Tax=Riccia sorocarpa TaxID=122646 RepID=A0ABD3HPJ5_9MARC
MALPVNKDSSAEVLVKAIRLMRQKLLNLNLSQSNVWKIVMACLSMKKEEYQLGPITNKHLFPAEPFDWENWVTERFVAKNDDQNISVIDPKDEEQIRAEAEKIKKFYVMDCREFMIPTAKMSDPISDVTHRPIIESYVRELEVLMKQSVETPSTATVIPYFLEQDKDGHVLRRFITFTKVEEVQGFIDLARHGWEQYEAFGRPPRTFRTKSDPFENFKDVLAQIFNVPPKNTGDLLWICTVSRELFHLWVTVCNAWINGLLLDPRGEEGNPQNARSINKNMFRSFMGCDEEMIKRNLQMVLNKELLLRVDSKYTGDLLSLNDFTENEKAEENTVKKVLEYYSDKYKAVDLTRDTLFSEFNLDPKGLRKLTSLLKLKKQKASLSKRGSKGEPHAKKLKSEDSVVEDRSFENRLDFIWFNTRGSTDGKSEYPWQLAPFKLSMNYEEAELTRGRQVSLVYVDLARDLDFPVTKELVETIILTAIGSTVVSLVLFVFLLFPGDDILPCLEVVKMGIVGWEIDICWGTCEFLDKTKVPKGCWHLLADATMLYLLFSNDDIEGGGDWMSAVNELPNKKEEQRVELSFHVDEHKDFDLHTIRKRSKDNETPEQTQERVRSERELQLLSLAPRFTDKDSKGALVNELTKSRRMINTYSWGESGAAPTDESQSWNPPSLADAEIEISKQPVQIALEEDDEGCDNLMDPEQAFFKRRGMDVPSHIGGTSSIELGEIELTSNQRPTSQVNTAENGVKSRDACVQAANSIVRRLSTEFSLANVSVQAVLQPPSADFLWDAAVREMPHLSEPGEAMDDAEGSKATVVAEGTVTAQSTLITNKMTEDDGHVIDPLPHPLSHVVTRLTEVEPPTAVMSAPAVENIDARLAIASGKDSSPDDPEYNYGLKQADAIPKTFNRKFIDTHRRLEPAPVGSRSGYPSVEFPHTLVGIGDVSSDLSASLTSLNIQIDEHGSFDHLVTEPTVNNYKVFLVRPKKGSLPRAHTTATVQGQRGKNPPTASDPRKKPIAKGAKTSQQVTGAPGPKAQAIKTRQTSSKNPK